MSYPFPPLPSVGGNRWLTLAKYLRRRGYEVTILTTSLFGSLPDDAEQDVTRAADILAWRWVRRALRRPPIPPLGQAAGIDTPPSSLLMGALVPDPYVLTWLPSAAVAARRLARERPIDCVITTTPYESTHLVGPLLGSDRPAWIADFRDGWCFEPHRPRFPLVAQRRLDAWLEQRCVRSADAVVAVERSVVEDFASRIGVAVEYVPNGWDPELTQNTMLDGLPTSEPGTVEVVHTGSLSGPWGRDPGPLLGAVQRLRETDARTAQRLRIVLAGRLRRKDSELLRAARLEPQVRYVGELPRAAALALQRRAAALVLITSHRRSEAPGKLFEYLGAGRPILVLGVGNDGAAIVEETRTGRCVPPHDIDAIAAGLQAAVSGDLVANYDPVGVERYMYPAPAEAMERVIETAIERRSERHRTGVRRRGSFGSPQRP